MTGYLLLTNGDASFARSGPLAMTRARQREIRSARRYSYLLRQEPVNLPAGRVVENARIGFLEARESCRMDLGLAKRGLSNCEKKEPGADAAAHAKPKEQTLTAGAAASRLQAIEDAIVV